VRVDETGKNIFAGGIDDFGSGRLRHVPLYLSDGFILAEDVRNITFACRYDFSIFDEQRHADFLG
jgi:hypothetical protein